MRETLKIILVFIITIFSFISCNNLEKQIIGKWEFIKYIEEEETLSISPYFIEFEKKNLAKVTGDGRIELKTGKVNYRITKNSIFLSVDIYSSGKSYIEEEVFTYEFINDTLVLINENGGMTYLKKEQ